MELEELVQWMGFITVLIILYAISNFGDAYTINQSRPIKSNYTYTPLKTIILTPDKIAHINNMRIDAAWAIQIGYSKCIDDITSYLGIRKSKFKITPSTTLNNDTLKISFPYDGSSFNLNMSAYKIFNKDSAGNWKLINITGEYRLYQK